MTDKCHDGTIDDDGNSLEKPPKSRNIDMPLKKKPKLAQEPHQPWTIPPFSILVDYFGVRRANMILLGKLSPTDAVIARDFDYYFDKVYGGDFLTGVQKREHTLREHPPREFGEHPPREFGEHPPRG